MRQRLVLSTLSGRPVKIRKIRAKDDNPGLRGSPALWGRVGLGRVVSLRRNRGGGRGTRRKAAAVARQVGDAENGC